MKNIILVLFLILGISCKKDKIKDEVLEQSEYETVKLLGKKSNLNISILLDLSDRINPKLHPNNTMDIYKRDIGYIKSIAQTFEIHVRNKKTRRINDKIQLFIDPEPEEKELNKKIKDLKINFTRSNAKRNSILQTSKKYEKITESIYESAIKDNSYIGSDIWRFFKNKVEDYCVEDGYRNILIILTDGYMYHKNSKKRNGNRSSYLTHNFIKNNRISNVDIPIKDFGYISNVKDLSNLEILVLGINPYEGNLNDEEIIHSYFEKWFKEMNVKKFDTKNTDLPSNTEKIIRKFIFESK
ncbi:hypothetical protein FDT66_13730 [Polaribacter aestuariivivens]|uniref:Uncharacterized protein n=1 Tax=Polaribacter aestuariivivens TaxID=2304626 RepID=A0A5S3N096_9FLAO|nr:hypothetical protein [Polaribacter aestuariivivens]TMM28658.1 hypothetical protein FDT66_13730 [Polaribacter aestuariivivens]